MPQTRKQKKRRKLERKCLRHRQPSEFTAKKLGKRRSSRTRRWQ